MKSLCLAAAALSALLLNTPAEAAISLGLSSVDGAQIQFTGSGPLATINFTNGPSGNSFAVTTLDGSPGGSAAGLFGSISGSFSYLVNNIVGFGPFQFASLAGTGVFSIGAAGGPTLTADIAGIDIASIGALGGVNGLTSAINLSNVQYSGDNTALLQLKNEATAGGGIVTFSYQFAGPKSLTSLATAGSVSGTTYSGSVTTGPIPVPEPGSLALTFSGAAVLGLGCYRRRRVRQAAA